MYVCKIIIMTFFSGIRLLLEISLSLFFFPFEQELKVSLNLIILRLIRNKY